MSTWWVRGWTRFPLAAALVLVVVVVSGAAPPALADAGLPPGVGAEPQDGTPADESPSAESDPGVSEAAPPDDEDSWWEHFNPASWARDIVDGVTDRVQQVITEKSVDATTAFVRAAFLPANAEMLTLAGLAADRVPPGRVQVIRRVWSGLWWAGVALLTVMALWQAIRVMVDRNPDVRGRARWVEWLMYPLVGVILGRASLFVVDALVIIQNELWRGALTDAPPCALLYGFCPGDSGTALTGAALRLTAGLFSWVLTAIPVLLLALLLALNWVFLALAALAGPVYIALAAGGRTPEPMAGWLGVVVRSALVQSWVGVALFVLLLFREAAQEPGLVGAFIRGLDGAGMIRFSVILLLDLAVVRWWLLPAFSAAADLVTLRGGQVLETTGQVAGVLGTLLAGAGVVTGNPALVAAGSKAAMAGRSASTLGAAWRENAQAQGQEQAGGGWITQPGLSFGRLSASDLATRTVAGLSPVAPYRVAVGGLGAQPGAVRITTAPGLAGAAASALLARGLEVRVETGEFEVPARDTERLLKALAPVLASDGGLVREELEAFRTHGLAAAQVEAVAKALARVGTANQVTPDGVQVAKKDADALRRAVAQVVTGAAVAGDRVRFTLPPGQAAAALKALDKAGIHPAATGSAFAATARLKGEKAGDIKATREAARQALAQAERTMLEQRPGYYRHAGGYVVVRPGEPVQTVDRPPENGLYLGEWPGRSMGAVGASSVEKGPTETGTNSQPAVGETE